MIAAFLLAAIPIAPQAPKPIETTIAALRHDPKAFDGKIVRVHGWVNRCDSTACLIDERPGSSPQGAGESLSIAGNAKFDSTVPPLAPTYVEVDAQFDAQCLISACPTPAPELDVVLLRGVIDATTPPPED
ncbi:MAG TPA: hypothetical protein VFT61_05385 [Sphingomicrobium sp.]|nr:hypothetical protein [Sphingomicrobium sp.]